MICTSIASRSWTSRRSRRTRFDGRVARRAERGVTDVIDAPGCDSGCRCPLRSMPSTPRSTPPRRALRPAHDRRGRLRLAAGDARRRRRGAAGVKLVTLSRTIRDGGYRWCTGCMCGFARRHAGPAGRDRRRRADRHPHRRGVGTCHAVSGAPEASRLVVFGAGVQARAHVEAMLAVRAITHVTVVGRGPGRR